MPIDIQTYVEKAPQQERERSPCEDGNTCLNKGSRREKNSAPPASGFSFFSPMAVINEHSHATASSAMGAIEYGRPVNAHPHIAVHAAPAKLNAPLSRGENVREKKREIFRLAFEIRALNEAIVILKAGKNEEEIARLEALIQDKKERLEEIARESDFLRGVINKKALPLTSPREEILARAEILTEINELEAKLAEGLGFHEDVRRLSELTALLENNNAARNHKWTPHAVRKEREKRRSMRLKQNRTKAGFNKESADYRAAGFDDIDPISFGDMEDLDSEKIAEEQALEQLALEPEDEENREDELIKLKEHRWREFAQSYGNRPDYNPIDDPELGLQLAIALEIWRYLEERLPPREQRAA